MKRYLKIVIFFIIVLILFFGFALSKNRLNNNPIKNIEVVNNNSLYESLKFYYKYNERKIYLYKLDDVILSINKNDINLMNYLKENKLEDFINLFEIKKIANDGGTIIYEDNTKYTKTGLTIIKCNTLEGNKDIYIGPKDMQLEPNFCIDNPYTFIKTYTIVNYKVITNDCACIDNNPYYEIYLYGKGTDVVKVGVQGLPKKIEKNKTYEFEFYIPSKNKKVEDNPESIFNNALIIDINETNKKIEEQVNMKPYVMID